MKLTAYALTPSPPPLRACPVRRDWMDAFPDRHAYRCLPLSIANGYGWELHCTHDFAIDWNGGPGQADITFTALDDTPWLEHFVASNFTHGIVTFHTGYLFRTPPDRCLLATGPLNRPKPGMAPLTGIVETGWVPYPFTMNWQLLAPGRHEFRKGEPFCTLIPVDAGLLRGVEVEIRDIADDPQLQADMADWGGRRQELLERMAARDPDALRSPWQRFYFDGRFDGREEASGHVTRLRLPDPVDRRGGGE
ncbi:MAG TPA: DUF6065 family protein [Azospirillaceae bacterium]|nr:DUF6065 family protein [Azospirillaceae bacterium]